MLHHELGRSSGDADPGQEEQAADTLGMFAYKHLWQEPDWVAFLVAHHLVHGQTELDTDKVSPVSTEKTQSVVPQLVPVFTSSLSETSRMPPTGLFSDPPKA
ncbi:hypothetical protein LTR70_005820 [Exophiala xenobiotica]|uniref:Uncharacterized protein n=1 Tax=Lithohypha guttulata TaxID=1690604 RepID=A0ABR0K0P5_9EURO|nr:hypothetical protein LTR24_008213 [Lithohypha guttulata]KAK5317625.1 hypothetical protein LTR70_005820 [Exophiala xenobiotica]